MISNKVTAVILAGGGNTRIGTNKALLELGNKTMIERITDSLKDIFKNILVVTNTPDEYGMLENVIFVKDCISVDEKNSLIGLYSGLKASKTSHIFVIACDMPFVNQELIYNMINLLDEEDVIIPFVGGHYQPLYALYGKKCIPEFEKLLVRRWYKIIDAFTSLKVKKVIEEYIIKFDPDMLCFENINTFDEYLKVKKVFE